jgi:hypothetical protein
MHHQVYYQQIEILIGMEDGMGSTTIPMPVGK